MVSVFRLITSVFADGRLDALVNAAEGLRWLFSNKSPQSKVLHQTELADKTISYAKAETVYYHALRAAMPELMDIATGKKPRLPKVDRFAQSFSVGGEKQGTQRTK